MIGTEVSIFIVFFQGLASFFSPCIFPLIPAYLTYLTGQSVDTMLEDNKAHRTLIWNSLAFIGGFSLVFILLGATASGLGGFLFENNNLFRQISGVIIIIFGLFHMGIIPINFLNREKRLNIKRTTPGIISSLLMGIGFSFGWTPCVGPVLSTVLVLAGTSSTLWNGVLLLAVYSLGLAIPFLLLAVFIKYLWKYLSVMRKHMKIIKIVSGAILVIVGILIFTNTLAFLV